MIAKPKGFKDLRDLRTILQELVEPYHHRVSVLKIEETLGISSFGGGRISDYDAKKHWHPDQVIVVVEFTTYLNSDFPMKGYALDRDQVFRAISSTRSGAGKEAVRQVREVLPKWKLIIDTDNGFAASVGKEVRTLRKLAASSSKWIEPGSIGKVIRHQPSWLYIDFGKGSIPISTRHFSTGVLRTTDKDTGETKPNWSPNTKLVSILDPEITFTDGYEPWRTAWEANKQT